MRIASFQIENYKSFLSSEEIHFARGFNVIVGQNNSGKTALIEALSLRLFNNKPHRSLETVPSRDANPDPFSQANISFELTRDELTEFLINYFPEFHAAVLPNLSPTVLTNRFVNVLSEQNIVIKCVFQPGKLVSAHFPAYGDAPYQGQALRFGIDPSNKQLSSIPGTVGAPYSQILAMQLADILKNRIYTFRAERLNVAEGGIGTDPILAPDASNLAEVLHLLQSSNVSRFRRFNEFVSTVFPEIKQITVPPLQNQRARILVWTINPDSEREDLAMPLSESGTGIGQVLAILYVIITSDYPRAILIDEPQSFLHPGAVRKLFDILKQHPQHQYIVTTHSPTVVTSADPQTFFLTRKEEAESTVEEMDVAETQKLRLFLSEIGARLSDVFGADNILWVEGRTEELCFPLILSRIAKQPLSGTEIIGVVQVGDFEGKHSKTILDIYKRLSEGRGLLPPAIGFLFDREGRSETERQDLTRRSRGTVSFTPRRMYENYLLNLRAIASIMSSTEGFGESPVTPEEVEKWLQRNRWNKEYFETTIGEEERTDEMWVTNVHGARILTDVFKELSVYRVNFDKIEHSVALTQWLIENAPEDLIEVAELIKEVLARGKTS